MWTLQLSKSSFLNIKEKFLLLWTTPYTCSTLYNEADDISY